METQIKYEKDKLEHLTLYVAAKCALHKYYGVLKLNKILFFSDFLAYRTLGKPITGAEYKKYTHGPAPRGMKALRKRLVDSGAAVEWSNPLAYLRGDGERMRENRLLPKSKPKIDRFSAEELSIVDSVIEQLRPHTGKRVSKMSHRHPGWACAEMGEKIPYASELLKNVSRPLSKKDLDHAQLSVERYATRAA